MKEKKDWVNCRDCNYGQYAWRFWDEFRIRKRREEQQSTLFDFSDEPLKDCFCKI